MSNFNIIENTKELGYEAAAEILLDDQLWHDAKMFVQSIDAEDMSNGEKHKTVKEKLMFLFNTIGHTLLDIAIKLAVLWLKNELAKKN